LELFRFHPSSSRAGCNPTLQVTRPPIIGEVRVCFLTDLRGSK
jgi:hypothetical protein